MSQNYKVISIRFDKNYSSYHDLFIKENASRQYDTKRPQGRTLLILNIPPYATTKNLKQIFCICGKIENVFFQNSAATTSTGSGDETCGVNGFKVGFVVFKTRESLCKALKLQSLTPLSSDRQPIAIGLNKWAQDYNASICDHEKLEDQVNLRIKQIDELEKQKKTKGKEEVDDDGWTVVTKKGRNPGVSRKESVEQKLTKKNKMKSMKKELKNFYTFQLKEQKMDQLAALRKSFEETKERINLMKRMRNFRPY